MHFPRVTITPLVAGIALGLGAVMLAYGALGGSDAAEPTASAARTLEEALDTYVRLTGGTYAGACEQTRSPEDLGKVCDRFVEEQGELRAHLLGRTFSEFDTWVFLADDGSGWTVLASAPLDFFDLTITIPWPR
jgi:hypothetical protein